MWGKKKSAQEFSEFATRALDQTFASMEATGLAGNAVLAADGMLHEYLGKRIDWRTLWTNASKRDRSLPPLGMPIYGDLARPTTTLLPFGSKPYWVPDADEIGKAAPHSVLAFLGRSDRMTL